MNNPIKYAYYQKVRRPLSYPNNSMLTMNVLCDNYRVLNVIYSETNSCLLRKTPPARLLEAIAEVQASGAPLMPAVVQQVLRLFPRPASQPARIGRGSIFTRRAGLLVCGAGQHPELTAQPVMAAGPGFSSG